MILTFDTADDCLTAHFLKEWGDRTPVILKNQKQEDIPQSADAWCRYAVLMTASAQDSYGTEGNRRFVRMGRVFVQIFVRVGNLTSLMNELSAKVVEIYENVNLNPVRVRLISQQDLPDGSSREAKVTGDGSWFGTLINVQFAFDEVK